MDECKPLELGRVGDERAAMRDAAARAAADAKSAAGAYTPPLFSSS